MAFFGYLVPARGWERGAEPARTLGTTLAPPVTAVWLLSLVWSSPCGGSTCCAAKGMTLLELSSAAIECACGYCVRLCACVCVLYCVCSQYLQLECRERERERGESMSCGPKHEISPN
jgi:hypothetical protein